MEAEVSFFFFGQMHLKLDHLKKKTPHTFHLQLWQFSPEHESTYRSDRSPNRQSVGESKGGGYSIIDTLHSFLEDICDSLQEAGNIHRETLTGFKESVSDWARDTELSEILPKFPSCSPVNIRVGKVLHSEVSRTLFGECKNIPSALFASSKQSDSQLKGKICTVS